MRTGAVACVAFTTTTLALTALVVRAGAASVVYRLAAIGDYGTNTTAEAQVAALVASWGVSDIITMGDNNYIGGANETMDANVGYYYRSWIAPYRGSFGAGSADGRNHFWPSIGNHDWYWLNGNSQTATLTPYLYYFSSLPGVQRYYKWSLPIGVAPHTAPDAATIDFFALDSDSHEPDGVTADSAQAQWLQRELRASCAVFRFVYCHHPPYSSGTGPQPYMRWPFAEWGADAVLTGHDHVYERSVPPPAEGVRAIPYFVNGLGGALITGWGPTIPGSVTRFADYQGAQRILIQSTTSTNATDGTPSATALCVNVTLAFHSADDGRLIDTVTLVPDPNRVRPDTCTTAAPASAAQCAFAPSPSPPVPHDDDDGGISAGAVVLIVLVVLAVVVSGGAVLYRRHRKSREAAGAHFEFVDANTAVPNA